MIRLNIWILPLMILLITGCNERDENSNTDSPEKGEINIVVDESFAPVIMQQVEQYQQLYPGTKINAEYLPEALALKKLFFSDDIRMGILNRRLTREEEKYLIDTLHFIPHTEKIASDALAVIVNGNSSDTLYTLDKLKGIINGTDRTGQTIVMDGLNATSAVRFVIDSLLMGQPLDTSIVKAAENSKAVINYVAENRNAIGLVGISWVGNPEKEEQVEMLKRIRIAYIQCKLCEGQPFVKPMTESIASRRYPLVRGLFYVLKENYKGLGSGFSSFLQYEKGQLIFRRAYLRPVMDFDIRNVNINETLTQ